MAFPSLSAAFLVGEGQSPSMETVNFPTEHILKGVHLVLLVLELKNINSQFLVWFRNRAVFPLSDPLLTECSLTQGVPAGLGAGGWGLRSIPGKHRELQGGRGGGRGGRRPQALSPDPGVMSVCLGPAPRMRDPELACSRQVTGWRFAPAGHGGVSAQADTHGGSCCV